MQPYRRHQGAKRIGLRFAVAFATPAFAVLVSSGFCTPSFSATVASAAAVPADAVPGSTPGNAVSVTNPTIRATPATVSTPWAETVRKRLGLAIGGSVTADAVPSHGLTSWTHSVEAHLSDRAHRVAQVGREALAWSESGMASWYGGRHAGHRTSSGDTFNPMQLTCAHPTLPLGTKVLVTSETTGRSVVVTVNDRGPFGGRIVDLSRAAAERIGMLGSGTASVTLGPASVEAVEVAEAEASDTSAQAIDEAGDLVNQAPHGRRHTRHAGR